MGYTFERIGKDVADYDTSFLLLNRGYEPDQYKAGQWFETTEEIYHHFLGAMSPLYFDGTAFMMAERSTEDLSDAFIQFDGRFFCLTAEHGGMPTIPNIIRAFWAHMGEGVPA